METESAGGIVVNDKHEIVLVFEEDFKGWILPKGHVENNETLEETSKREIFEETGLEEMYLFS
jgi:ADP-ribose pyrophosphatase YjhB (NUDIX family)